MFGVYSFYSIQSELAVYLIVFWGVFMAIWPLKLPQLLSSISFSSQEAILPIGKLLRLDNPGVLRFAINQSTTVPGWWCITCRDSDQAYTCLIFDLDLKYVELSV